MSSPRYTIHIYNYHPDDILHLAVHADRLGFDGLWAGEHYILPQSYSGEHPSEAANGAAHKALTANVLGPHVRIYDPWFLLGMVAGATKRLKIGTAIVIVPLNNPLLLARHTVTAHDLSGGRFMLGTGAGWLREEFDAVGIPFEQRGSRLDETIEILRKAWAGGYFGHEGRHFRFDPVQISPHPVDVPIVCGGNSGPALRRVARVADAWINSANITLDQARSLRETIVAEREAHGTAGRPFRYYVKPFHNADVPGFIDAGFEDIVLWGPNVWSDDPAVPLDQKIRQLESVAAELGIRAPADRQGDSQ